MSEENIEDVTFENNDDNLDKEQDNEDDATKQKPKPERKSRKSKTERKIKELQDQCDELNDKYLRLYSEFDNYRKRTNKERLELLKSASQDVIVDLLPVLDDFDRAMTAIDEHGVDEETKKGLLLIYNKLYNILSQKGLESMNSFGKDFDTDYHEAITNIPAPSKDLVGKVVDVIEKGYLLNGKIIRFAKVVIGS